MASNLRARGWYRGVKLIGIVLVIALGLVALVPLCLRGPVARWAFDQAFSSRCGDSSIGGAQIGWGSVVQLALGRPMHVTIEDVSILGPDGRPFLQVARLAAAVKVELSPLRMTVVDASAAQGRWRLTIGPDGAGSLDAFRPAPPQGRAACLAPARAALPAAAGNTATVVVEAARFSDLDVDLDFPSWRLALSRVRAQFSLSFDRVLRFDVHEVAATGGNLRVGGATSEWRAAVPFDGITIDRVAVADAATDLLLEVASARTGRAELAGRAVFHNIFPPAVAPAGLDVDARWRRFGGALAMLDAGWRPPAQWAEHLDGELHVTMGGAFDDLRATLDARGQGTDLRAGLHHGLASLHLDIHGADTHWMVGPALSPLLGGRLHGSLAARLRLAPSLSRMDGEVDATDLRLERGPGASGPEQVVLRVGAPVRTAGQDHLSVTMRRVRLAAGQLHISDAEVAGPSLSLRAGANVAFAEGRLTLAFPPPSALIFGSQRLQLPRDVTLRWDERTGLSLSPFRLHARNGASLQVAGRIFPDEHLEGHVLVRAYPLGSLPWSGRAELAGMLSGSLRLSGLTTAPSVRGNVRVPDLTFRGRAMGEARASLRLDRGIGRVTVRIADSLAATATIVGAPRLTVAAEISMKKQALGPWLPPPLVGAPIVASGKASLTYSLAHPLVMNTTVALIGPGLDDVGLSAQSSGQSAVAKIHGQVELAPWGRLWSPYLAGAEGAVSVDFELRDPFVAPTMAGTAFIVRELKLRLRHGLGTVRIFAGDRVAFESETLSARALRVDTSWFRGKVSGHAEMKSADLRHVPLSLAVDGDVDFSQLPAAMVGHTLLHGRATVAGQLDGQLSEPTVRGDARLDDVVVQTAWLPRVSLNGNISADGHRLTTRGLVLDVAQVGRIVVGDSASVASLAWSSLDPLRLGALDVPFFGENLVVSSARPPLRIRDLDVEGRLTGTPGALVLVGNVTIAGGVLDVARAKSSGPGRRRPWYADLPPGLTVDLRLRGPKQAMRLAVPFLPDVTVDFDCRLRGTRSYASLTGDLHGHGPYDRTAVNLYAWLASKDLHRCGLQE